MVKTLSTNEGDLSFCRCFEMAIWTSVRWYLIELLICLCVRMSDAEHVFMCLIKICMSSSKKYPFLCFARLCLGLLCFWYWAVWGSLYVLEMNSLWVSSFANISSHSRLQLSFILGFLCCASAFMVNWVLFSYFWFIFHSSKRCIQKDLAVIYVIVCPGYTCQHFHRLHPDI